MTWLVASASLYATWLNVHRRRACFAIWIATNLAWSFYDFTHDLPAQGALMAVYACLAVKGWREWGRHA